MNIFEAYLINKGSFRNIIAKFYIKRFILFIYFILRDLEKISLRDPENERLNHYRDIET